MLFGIYPGGVTGTDSGQLTSGPPDDPARITQALTALRERGPFLVRAYLGFDDSTPDGPHATVTPAGAARYTGNGRVLDLVAQYQSPSGDVDGYRAFVRRLVEQYGAVTGTLQIAEEPNVPDNPVLDGYYPRVIEAIVAGVAAAKERAAELGHDLRVGFNTTPLFGPGASFIADLAQAGGAEFVRQVDYVGLDFFPDVFRPVGPAEAVAAVAGLLRHHRENVLAPAGFGDVPLHITEHGWPTGPDRPAERQAEVVETVVRAAADAGVSCYTHFSLRDADSAQPGLFHQFGLLRDDYTRKPAFDTYRKLIAEFTR
ncbi:hypothetical protein [Amycolatopsis ruanii]|uniref:hypothetical protein n=1 Tax=Amycolatopsis ruanii TaxID=944491 RepID=UPI000E2512D5|nr:hypothetical protein [Amycolatopsis ruanii]